jgi:hypothetical protein
MKDSEIIADNLSKPGGSWACVSAIDSFGRLGYGEPNAVSNAIGYAKFYNRSHDGVVRIYDATAM